MKKSIVLYGAPSFHHMVSMLELGKLILQHHPYLSITILAVDTTTTSSYIDQLSQTTLPISFFALPSIDLPQSLSTSEATFERIKLNAANVVDALTTMPLTSKVLALVTSAIHVSYHPQIPTYYYFTSCASALAAILYLPNNHHHTTRSFREQGDTILRFPGLPPIKASDMPDALYDHDDPAYHYFLNVATCLPKSKGIIINTIEALEPRVIKAIRDGACVPNEETHLFIVLGL